MSRLIVKNLPAYLTQQQLREHFESKDGPGGALTDVKVVLKPDGTSRRFGFVGFKKDIEAQNACKWFDKTFIHSSRINVAVIEVNVSRNVLGRSFRSNTFRARRMPRHQDRTSDLALRLLRLKKGSSSRTSPSKRMAGTALMVSSKSSCKLCNLARRRALRGAMATRFPRRSLSSPIPQGKTMGHAIFHPAMSQLRTWTG